MAPNNASRGYTVRPAEAGQKLVEYLAAHEGCSLRKAKALLDTRSVFVNGKRVWMAKHALHQGDNVELPSAPRSTNRSTATPTVLFESREYVVVNKPAGLLSNGPNSVEHLLRKDPMYSGIQAVHRLDKDTTGCLCLARTPEAVEQAVNLFREGRVLKIYHAIVLGRPDQQERTLTRRMDGKSAVTHWNILSATDKAAHLQLKIDTGRTHQIRKHLSHIGHPVLGDREYFTRRMDDKRLRALPRQMLHAGVFQAPLEAGDVRVTAPLPDDFKKALALFRLR